MSYKTIVVHLDAGARRSERLGLGCELAARCDAHLIGLFALEDMRVPYAFGGTAGALLLMEERWRKEVAAEAKREFETVSARNGVKAEWRGSTRNAVAALALNARYADLLILGQHESGASSDERLPGYFVEETVLTAGRPVLVVPYVGHYPTVGGRVLVAWNASREAARAVTDALPLLHAAKAVEVVAFDPMETGADHGQQPGADIALYLARHGVKATAARQSAKIDAGAQILSYAADFGADLIVMGAYGRSRVRELVLGGATRAVLESMTVPVLMAH